jgi:hypothetical protein
LSEWLGRVNNSEIKELEQIGICDNHNQNFRPKEKESYPINLTRGKKCILFGGIVFFFDAIEDAPTQSSRDIVKEV